MRSPDGLGRSSVVAYLKYDLHQRSFPVACNKTNIVFLFPAQFSFIPEVFRYNTFDSASINLRNSWRKDDEKLPIEFLYTPSEYRAMYTADMIFNVTLIWETAANVVWGHEEDFLTANGVAGKLKWKSLGQLIWGKLHKHEEL